MITLITGLPGHGKTLYTIWLVEQTRQATGRQVYYKRKASETDFGIEGLTLPWIPFDDAAEWHLCPAGSIIVLDECQHLFKSRRQGEQVPVHVEKVSTHRHQGHDLFLITQDAMQFDAFVRRLVGKHIHVKRAFGLARARVYEWQGLGNPNDYHSKKDCLKSWWEYPEKVFDQYKSAEVHTVQKTIPLKPFFMIGGGIAACVGLIVLAMATLSDGGIEEPSLAEPSVWSGQISPGPSGGSRSVPVNWNPKAWSARVNDVPQSAAVWDGAVNVKAAPRVTGCLSMRVEHDLICRCSTQQGTDAGISQEGCLRYVAKGSFDLSGQVEGYYPRIEPYVRPLPVEPGGGLAATLPAEGISSESSQAEAR